jgi:hypothetical protein
VTEKEIAFEKLLMMAAEKIDSAAKLFVVGLESAKTPDRKWYSPTAMLARIGTVVALSSKEPLAQVIGVGLYGSIHLLGIKGTTQLLLNLRRKHNDATKRKKNTAQSHD